MISTDQIRSPQSTPTIMTQPDTEKNKNEQEMQVKKNGDRVVKSTSKRNTSNLGARLETM